MRSLYIPIAALLALVISACSITPLDVYEAAETPSQKAYALYGSFVEYQQTAFNIVSNPQTPIIVVRVIQQAEAVAKPLADTLLVAADAYVVIAAQYVGGGNVTAAEVAATLVQLKDAVAKAGPSITGFIDAIVNIKKPQALNEGGIAPWASYSLS